MRMTREQSIIQAGSPLYQEVLGALSALTTYSYDKDSSFPQAELFPYFNGLYVMNNSAQTIAVQVNENVYRILPYQNQPITGRYFTTWQVANLGAVGTAAGEIIIQAQLFSSQIPEVITKGG
jgi:hypothetical protein